MNTSKPQFSLDALAEAVAIHDGIRLDPKVEVDRERLLEIAADLLEDPVKRRGLLKQLTSKRSAEKAAQDRPAPWAYKGQIRYLETAAPIAEDDFLFDDIDHLRTTDAFGRPLKLDEHDDDDELEDDGDYESSSEKVFIRPHVRYFAPPSLLGFEDDEPSDAFDYQAFRKALTRVHQDLSKSVKVEWKKRPTPSHHDKLEAVWQQRDLWKVHKTVRAENFHEVTVSHDKKDVYVAYLGSGEDVYLVVAINNIELFKAKESLLNAKQVSSRFLATLNAEPDAGLMIVDSILEDLPAAAMSFQSRSREP